MWLICVGALASLQWAGRRGQGLAQTFWARALETEPTTVARSRFEAEGWEQAPLRWAQEGKDGCLADT